MNPQSDAHDTPDTNTINLQTLGKLSLGNEPTETSLAGNTQGPAKMRRPSKKQWEKLNSSQNGNPSDQTSASAVTNAALGNASKPEEVISKKAKKKAKRGKRKAEAFASIENLRANLNVQPIPQEFSEDAPQAPPDGSVSAPLHNPQSTVPALDPLFSVPQGPFPPFGFSNGLMFPPSQFFPHYPPLQFPTTPYTGQFTPWMLNQQSSFNSSSLNVPGPSYMPGSFNLPLGNPSLNPMAPAFTLNASLPNPPFQNSGIQGKVSQVKVPQGATVTKPMEEIPLKAPEPSPEYLAQASREPQNIGHPQPLLIVLDLNGTLLHRNVGSTKFVERPCLRDFLNYCFTRHRVMVWSSAKPGNVRTICSKLFSPAQSESIVAIWGRDTLGLTKREFLDKVQVYKRLETIWNDARIQRAHPWIGGSWSQSNTILIDDSLIKAKGQPYNHIEVPEFTPGPRAFENQAKVLKQVVEYISAAESYGDFSSFAKHNKFVVRPVADETSAQTTSADHTEGRK